MDEVVKKDILRVLSDVANILKIEEEKDIVEIRELSNHTIHNASIFQDEDSVSIAILIYSLSKVIERREGKLNYKNLLRLITDAKKNLEYNRIDAYRKTIKKLFNFISTIDTKLKLYIEQVINQAEIKKGSKLYAHGISLGRAAEILGISQWELMFYIGKTKQADVKGGVNVKTRLNYARSLFK
jgi:hypothetical protein